MVLVLKKNSMSCIRNIRMAFAILLLMLTPVLSPLPHCFGCPQTDVAGDGDTAKKDDVVNNGRHRSNQSAYS